MTPFSFNRSLAAGALALIGGLALVATAQAQQMGANSAAYNAGYGRVAGQENRGVDYGTRDSSANRLIVDGVIQSGEDQSTFSRASGGVFSNTSGVGGVGGGATAIGNNLVVVTQGNWNTVIVTSVQTNSGDVTAGATANGGDDD